MCAERGLGDAELLGKEQCTHPVPFQIPVKLWGEMRSWVLQPVQDHQTALIRERLDGFDALHFVILRSS